MTPAFYNQDFGLSQESAAVQTDQSHHRRRLKRWAIGLALGMTTTGLTGCTMLGGLQQKLHNSECIDDFMVSHRNKVMAVRAWLCVKPCYHKHGYLKDLRAGFIAGYLDVATGGAGCTPSVVSSQYWGWRHQSGNGQAAVNAWFEGFPLGVKAAEQDGIGHYGMIQLNTVRQVTSNMTGSAAPTPAMSQPEPIQYGMPMSHSVDMQGSSELPPGIVLEEGETLVPGQISVQDIGPESIPDGTHVPDVDDAMGDDTSPEDAMPHPKPKPEGEPTDPFIDEIGRRSGLLPNQQTTDYIPATAAAGTPQSRPVPDDSTMELVPKTSTPVSIQRMVLPDSGESSVAEPSQADIDSVIEEIFGKPSVSLPQ